MTESKKPSNLERLLRGYMAMRTKRSEIKREYEEQDGTIKAKMALVEVQLMRMMTASGSDTLKVKGVAQAIAGVKQFTKAKDWDAIWKFIEETGSLDLLQRRLSVGAIKEFMDANNGELPPGVDVTQERTVTVRIDN